MGSSLKSGSSFSAIVLSEGQNVKGKIGSNIFERNDMKNYRHIATLMLLLLLACLLPVLTQTGAVAGPEPPYKDPSLPIEKRVDDLVARMTLQEQISQMMNAAPAIKRLDVPEYEWWNEGLHGVARAGYATVFPQAIGLAATWDTDLMHQV